jgi:hypothetical protein
LRHRRAILRGRPAPANILDPVAIEATRAKLAAMRDGLA